MSITLFEAETDHAAPVTAEHDGEFQLRDYQREAVTAIHKAFDESTSTLFVCATGVGKTVIASHAIRERMHHGRVMVVVHRDELLNQAAQKLADVCGCWVDIEKADQWAERSGKAKIVVTSVQTQVSGMAGKGRMSRFDPSEFATLWCDESHHATAPSWLRVINYYRQNPKLRVLGCTATPDRHDEEALGKVFDSVAYTYELDRAISDGWLVPIHQRIVRVSGLDFSKVRETAGDLNGADLAAIMEYEDNLHRIAHPTIELAGERQTLVFTVTVAQAERLAEIFNRHRADCARVVTGKTPHEERRQLFADYQARRFQFLCNVGVVTEGVDVPGIECVSMARPTKSRALYAQMAGRACRPLTGIVDGIDTPELRRAAIAGSRKPSMEVIDFTGNAGQHKLMTTADILGGNYTEEEVAEAAKIAEKESDAGRTSDVQRNLDTARKRIMERLAREAALEGERRKRSGLVGFADYSTAVIDCFDTLQIEPVRVRGWDQGRLASEAQVKAIVRETNGQIGLDEAKALNVRHASQIIDKFYSTPTVKQARQLKRFGLPMNINRKKASAFMQLLAKHEFRSRPSREEIDEVMNAPVR